MEKLNEVPTIDLVEELIERNVVQCLENRYIIDDLVLKSSNNPDGIKYDAEKLLVSRIAHALQDQGLLKFYESKEELRAVFTARIFALKYTLRTPKGINT